MDLPKAGRVDLRARVFGMLGLCYVSLTGCRESTAPDNSVAAVAISGGSSALAPLATRQLTAEPRNKAGDALPGKTVIWESDDEDVALVSAAGLVTGVAPGTVVIRAVADEVEGDLVLTVAYRACSSTATMGALTLGDTVAGQLSHAGCAFDGVGPFDGRSLTITTLSYVVFEISSEGASSGFLITNAAMDYLFVGSPLQPGEGTRALLVVTPGTYYVWAAADGELRPYSLSATLATLCNAADALGGSLAADLDINSQIEEGGCLLPHGYEAQAWTMTLVEPTSLRLDVTAAGFNPWIVVTDLELNIVAESPFAVSSRAVLAGVIPAGDHLVWVTSFDGGAGPFTLRRGAFAPSLCDGGGPFGTATIGGTMNGEIDQGDCRLPDGRPADLWTLEVAPGATLRIDMTSASFDTYLVVLDESGEVIADDDDGGDGINSRVTHIFVAGTYTIVATSYWIEGAGPYALQVAPSAGLRSSARSIQPAKKAPHRAWNVSPLRP